MLFRSQDNTLSRVHSGASYLVAIDIAGYYVNIDVDVLLSALREIEAPSRAVEQLGVCLRRWAQIHGRGLPQGHGASDILAELFLNPVDRELRAMGYSFFRCLDEFRIFCRSRAEAENARTDLTRLLHERGLTPQSAKSGLYRTRGLRWYLAAMLPVLFKRYKNSTPPLAHAALAQLWLFMNLRLNYTEHLDGILNMLQASNNPAAVKHGPELLKKYPHPYDTRRILIYCDAVSGRREIERVVVAFLASSRPARPYQDYEIIDWLCRQDFSRPSDSLLIVIRNFALDEARPCYVRSVSRKFLGDYGSAADLDLLARSYPGTADSFERAEIICCLKRMEEERRSAFLATIARDDEWVRRAIKFIGGAPENIGDSLSGRVG